MSCYFRHMKEIFAAAGIEPTPGNKRQLDRIIHKIVGIDYKNCSQAWRAVKNRLKEDPQKKEELVKKLKVEWKTLVKENL